MIRSKKVQDYFEARFEVLKPELSVYFDIYLYFPLNRHIMQWKPKGEILNLEFLEKYLNKGLHKIFIHKSERNEFERYLAELGGISGIETPQDIDKIAGTAPPPAKRKAKAGEREAAFITKALDSEELKPEAKEALIAESAQSLLKNALKAKTFEEQKEKNKKLRNAVREILENQGFADDPAQAQIWALTEVDSSMEHSANVATYGVILAMSFGQVDKKLINDIASAGLLHDIGMAFVPHQIASLHIKNAPAKHVALYETHVNLATKLLDTYAPKIATRVKTIITQHHEKFDGTGFPKKLKGFQVDDVASLISIADLLDAVGSGQYDGIKRSFQESFELIEKMEQNRTFPEYFNPEVFGSVMKFVREKATAETMSEAATLVEAQKAEVIGVAA